MKKADPRMTDARILIVEDDEALVGLLERMLRNGGYTSLRSTSDPRQALPLFREFQPDLVVMDLRMPHLDGIAVMQQLRGRLDPSEFLPVLMITGDSTTETKQRALTAGATDFLTKPFESAEVLLRIGNLLKLRRMQSELTDALRRNEQILHDMRIEMARRLALAAEYRDSEDGAHPVRVGELSGRIAHALNLSDAEVEQIRLAAPLHDVGMVGIPDGVVHKEGSLTLEELDLIKTHTSIGARILSNSDSPLLQLAEEIALYHHEAWDGSGYTPGLSGESIPLAARIVAVADTFYAMTRERPYQKPHTVDDAVSWISSQAGKRYDPQVVQAFVRVCATDDLPMLQDDDH